MARGLKFSMSLFSRILSLLLTLQFGKYNVVHGQGSFITIPALGRSSELGNLYDERSGQFIQDYIFTSKQSILSHVTTETVSNTTQKSAVIKNFSDKLKFFDLDLNTAVDIMSGLTQPTGSAQVLQIRNNTVSGLFMTTFETVKECLPLFKPGLKEFINPSSPNSAKATHVVTGVTWGGRNLVSVTLSSTNYTVKLLLNHLKILLNGPQNSSELSGGGDDNDFSIHVYSDAHQPHRSWKSMYNLSEAHEILNQMPSILQHMNGGKGIPLEYTLTPLSTVREYFNQPRTTGVVSYPTPDVFILDIINAVDDIHNMNQELEKVISELSFEPNCTNPSTVNEIISLKASFDNAVAQFLQKLSSVLVQFRSGMIRTHNLFDLLAQFKDSENSHENVPHLLAEFDQQLESTKFCTNLQSFYSNIKYIGTGQGFTLLNTINQSMESNHTIYILYKKDEFVQNKRNAWKENVHTLLKVLDQPYNTRLIVDCDSAEADECEGVDEITLRQIKNVTVTIENVVDELKTEVCLPNGQSVLNLCKLNECQNEAFCKLSPDFTDFICSCPNGFTGRLCEIKVEECWNDGVPCSDLGKCDTRDGSGLFSCFCSTGHTGQYCNINIDDCFPHACSNGGTCIDEINSFRCECSPGFKGNVCEVNIDDCRADGSLSPCLHGGTCHDKLNSYSCACAAGYEGLFCEIATNNCVGKDTCLNGGSCTSQINSYTCICSPGYSGANCEIDIDDCNINAMCINGGSCIDEVNTYRCACAAGYSGTNCEINLDECAVEENNCANGGTCVDGLNDFTCYCTAGYTGPRCETNIDDCVGNHRCYNSGTCMDGIHSYTCACLPGFSGKNCEINIDECAGSARCSSGGTCVDGINTYTCFCPPGFTGRECDGNVNECVGNDRCYNGGTCLDGVNSYSCKCAEGFTGSNCEVNVDDCAGTGKCSNGGICIDGVSSFTCYCPPGYTGRQCDTNINDCIGNDRCYNGGLCIDGVNSYSCNCAAGYTGSNCEANVDDCAGKNMCLNGGTCTDQINSYTCICRPGYTGNYCEINVDDCLSNDICFNGGTCIDGINTYRCICATGYTGLNCQENANECAGKTKCHNGGTCEDGVRGFTCYCAPGYTGTRCNTLLNNCGGINHCYNGATCLSGINSYSCACDVGFTGKNCETNIDDCIGGKCSNGGTCVDGINGFTCYCAPGYTGRQCNTNIDDCAGVNPCYNDGTCVDKVNGYTCTCKELTHGDRCEHATCDGSYNKGSLQVVKAENCGGLIAFPNYPSSCESAFLFDYKADTMFSGKKKCLWTFEGTKQPDGNGNLQIRVAISSVCMGNMHEGAAISVLNWKYDSTAKQTELKLYNNQLRRPGDSYLSEPEDLKVFLSYTSSGTPGLGFLVKVELLSCNSYWWGINHNIIGPTSSTSSTLWEKRWLNDPWLNSVVVNPQSSSNTLKLEFKTIKTSACEYADILMIYEIITTDKDPKIVERICTTRDATYTTRYNLYNPILALIEVSYYSDIYLMKFTWS